MEVNDIEEWIILEYKFVWYVVIFFVYNTSHDLKLSASGQFLLFWPYSNSNAFTNVKQYTARLSNFIHW